MATTTNGIPMSLNEMREYLQTYYGLPIALRLAGTATIKCPFCDKMHGHGLQPGHQAAGCSDEDRYDGGINIGDRFFTQNYGYTIVEYVEKDGVNQILPLD